MTIDDLQQQLAKKIISYVDAGKPKSFLARKTGITIPTIDKYLQREYSSKPTVEVVYPLLSFFSSPYDASAALKELFPSWWEHTGKFIAPKGEISSPISNWNRIHASIFAKSFSVSGVCDDWIQEHFGKTLGFEARDELITNNFIEMKSGRYFKAVEHTYDVSAESILRQIAVHVETFPKNSLCDKNNSDRNGAYLHLMTNIPKEGREKVFSVLKEARVKIQNLVDTYKDNSLKQDERFTVSILFDWDQNN